MSFERLVNYFNEAPVSGLGVDYGAGDRSYESMLRAKFMRYIAADFVATHSSFYAANTPDIMLKGGPLPLDDMSVDCIVLTEVLEHIYDPISVLAELKRVLKP